MQRYTIFYKKNPNFNRTYFQNEARDVGVYTEFGIDNARKRVEEMVEKGITPDKIVNGAGNTVTI